MTNHFAFQACSPLNTVLSPTILVKVNTKLGEPATARELQVLSLWLIGLTMPSIGKLLVISPRTVESHLHHVREKLQLRSRVEVLFWLLSFDLYDDLFRLAKSLFRGKFPEVMLD